MDNDRLRMIFGFSLLLALAALAAMVALARVHQDSSYGLDYILGALSALSGGFAQWAFGSSKSSPSLAHQPRDAVATDIDKAAAVVVRDVEGAV